MRYQEEDLIPWRREFGAECGICPWVIEANEALSRRSKQELAQWLRDDTNFQQYMADYVRSKNESGGCRQPKRMKTKVAIEVRAMEALRYKLPMGYLWPIAVY